MSPQALALLIAFGVVMVVMVVAILVLPLPASYNMGKLVLALIVLVFVGALFGLQVYGVNCMVEGRCEMGSWMIVMVLVWVCLLYVIFALVSIAKSGGWSWKKKEEETPKATGVVKVDAQTGQIAS